jgi:hypothetical protein
MPKNVWLYGTAATFRSFFGVHGKRLSSWKAGCPGPAIRDAIVTAICLEKSWGDKTPLELFLASVQGLPANVLAMLCLQPTA